MQRRTRAVRLVMTLRAIARDIVKMRAALIARLVAELREDEHLRNLAQLELYGTPSTWPLIVQMRVDLDRRVRQPAQRKIDREGVLAQASTMTGHIELDTTAWDNAMRDLTENRERE